MIAFRLGVLLRPRSAATDVGGNASVSPIPLNIYDRFRERVLIYISRSPTSGIVQGHVT